jgi:membrane protein DedA with SNARE-associated domain
MAPLKFLAFTVIGCAVWCTALVSLGYSLGASYNHVLKGFSYAGYVLAALAVLAVAFVLWHRWRQYRLEREQSRTETQV